MWLRACANADVAVESAANAASDSSPRPSAWSISPWTHDSGPTSNSGAVSVDKAEGSVGSIRINRETHHEESSKIRARRGSDSIFVSADPPPSHRGNTATSENRV